MYNFKKILAFYLETPMHPGTGSVVNSTVDLPIQREITTKFPFIQSSTIKGNLRNFARICSDWGDSTINKVFGEEDNRGSMSITDAKLLLFPVRSLDRIFCWITCPLILQRFARDLEIIGKQIDLKVPLEVSEEIALFLDQGVEDSKLNVENYIFKLKKAEGLESLLNLIQNLIPTNDTYNYLRESLKKNLFILNDNIFKYLVNTETEVIPRIRIDQETGVTQEGALFYEEYLPTDTLMYCLLLFNDDESIDFKNKVSFLSGKSIQIGGNMTIGKGLTTIVLIE